MEAFIVRENVLFLKHSPTLKIRPTFQVDSDATVYSSCLSLFGLL